MSERLLLRVVEAAELLSISRAQAYVWINEGRIPSVRIGSSIRVPARQLEDLIARKTRFPIGTPGTAPAEEGRAE
jgi:excisionase family DNA binding protein